MTGILAWLARLGLEKYATVFNEDEITLGLIRLGRPQGAELVAKVTQGRRLPAEARERIVAHTDGVPLLVEALTDAGLVFRRGAPPRTRHTRSSMRSCKAGPMTSCSRAGESSCTGALPRRWRPTLPIRCGISARPSRSGRRWESSRCEESPVRRRSRPSRRCGRSSSNCRRRPGAASANFVLREPLNSVLTGMRGWDSPEGANHGSAILDLAKSQRESRSLLLGLWAMWSNTVTQGRISDSMVWARRLLPEGEQSQDPELLVFGHTFDSMSNYYLGHLLLERVSETDRLGGRTRIPYVKSALAEALTLQGDVELALTTIDECLPQLRRPGWQERSHLAEVLRLTGWILMRLGRRDGVEAPRRTAIDWARQRQARSWELRASTTPAQLLVGHRQRDTARALLAPICAWFSEGFDTRNLRKARTLLGSLS